MNKAKLRTWLSSMTYPMYLGTVKDGKIGGNFLYSPICDFDAVYPTVGCAEHAYSKQNFDDFIESLPEFEIPKPPKTVTLEESIDSHCGQDVLIEKSKKRGK